MAEQAESAGAHAHRESHLQPATLSSDEFFRYVGTGRTNGWRLLHAHPEWRVPLGRRYRVLRARVDAWLAQQADAMGGATPTTSDSIND